MTALLHVLICYAIGIGSGWLGYHLIFDDDKGDSEC